MLFADGHVEEWGDLKSSLASAGNFVLPSPNPGGNPPGLIFAPVGPRQNFSPVNADSGGGGSFNRSTPPLTPAASQPERPQNFTPPSLIVPGSNTPASPADLPPPIQGHNQTSGGKILSAQNQIAVSGDSSEIIPAATTGQIVGITNDEDAGMSPANQQLAKLIRHLIGAGYLLLLLLLLLYLAYRIWRQTRRDDRRW